MPLAAWFTAFLVQNDPRLLYTDYMIWFMSMEEAGAILIKLFIF